MLLVDLIMCVNWLCAVAGVQL